MTEEEKRDVVLDNSNVLEDNNVDQFTNDSIEVLQPDSLVSSEVVSSSDVAPVLDNVSYEYVDKSNIESIDSPTTLDFESSTAVETTFTPTTETDNASTMFAFTEESTPVSVEITSANSNPFMYAYEPTHEAGLSENEIANQIQQPIIENSFSYNEPSNISQVIDTPQTFAYTDQSVPTVSINQNNDFVYENEQSIQSSSNVENNSSYAYVEQSLAASESSQQVPTGTYNPKVNFPQENRNEEKSSLGFMVVFGIIMLIIVIVLPYFV